MEDIKDTYPIGTEVNVSRWHGDEFNHDFTGHVIGYRGPWIQVRDQDDDVWDCDPEQLSFNTDEIMHRS